MVAPIHTIEKTMWEAFLAFLMLCGGSAVLVLLYMWFAWYASLNALRFRPPHNNGAAPTKNGLSVSDIQKLPTFIFTAINEGMDCCVCLEQLKDGEKCLLMPSCSHCFHLDCAVAWLSKQPLCPVCRSRCDPQQQQQQGSSGSHDQHVPDALTIDVLSQR